jgi:hypothetical protein
MKLLEMTRTLKDTLWRFFDHAPSAEKAKSVFNNVAPEAIDKQFRLWSAYKQRHGK